MTEFADKVIFIVDFDDKVIDNFDRYGVEVTRMQKCLMYLPIRYNMSTRVPYTLWYKHLVVRLF